MKQLQSELSVSNGQLQQSTSDLAILQRQVLQLSAVAEAWQARLAAVQLTAQMQAATNGSATPTPDDEHALDSVHTESWHTVIASMGPQLGGNAAGQASVSTAAEFDPKVQRIQELRTALAAALQEAGTAGNHGDKDSVDPKLQRIHQLTSTLMSAAQDADMAGGTANLAVGTDAKMQRIQELRSALASAVSERDELLQQMSGDSSDLYAQLQEAKEQLADIRCQLAVAQVQFGPGKQSCCFDAAGSALHLIIDQNINGCQHDTCALTHITYS